MKICIISFDYFNFDSNILLELKRRNIDANHIDISKFKYKYTSILDKISNFFTKLLFNENKKKKAMEKDILNRLEKLGHQDIILVIRPDRITKKTHLEIAKHTNKYICYIYDSCKRFPVDHLLKGIFDEVFSFDLEDCKKYGFTFISNFIYLDKKELQPFNPNNNRIFIILSIDERLPFLNKLANYLSNKNIAFTFIITGKRRPKNINPNITHIIKPIYIDDLRVELEKSDVFLDLIRFNHNGLSFRIFEALAMQKKIITTNKSIKEYDFYNPNNILVLDEKEAININPDFINTPYEPLSDDLYYKYTLENWVNTVFKI